MSPSVVVYCMDKDFEKMLVFSWYLQRVPRNELEGASSKIHLLVDKLFREDPPWLSFEGLGDDMYDSLPHIAEKLREYAAPMALNQQESNPY